MLTHSVGCQHDYARRFIVLAMVFVGIMLPSILPYQSEGVGNSDVLQAGRGGPSYEDYRRVKHGMSRVEVEQVLGGPPGNYSTGRTEFSYFFGGPNLDRIAAYSLWWTGDEVEVEVFFDAQDRVVFCLGWRNLKH